MTLFRSGWGYVMRFQSERIEMTKLRSEKTRGSLNYAMTTELATTEPREFEFALTARLRHGTLWRLVKQFGTQKALADHLGIGQVQMGKLVNLHRPPVPHCPW